MPYVAPVKDMLFVMNELAGLSDVVAYPSYAEAGADVDLAPAILEESAKFTQDIIAPLNWPGDQNPSSLKDGVVTTTPGFREAFEQFAAAGWQGVTRALYAAGGHAMPEENRGTGVLRRSSAAYPPAACGSATVCPEARLVRLVGRRFLREWLGRFGGPAFTGGPLTTPL